MKIKIKKLNNFSVLPTKTNDNDAGWDLYASDMVQITSNSVKVVPTGIAMNIPAGYFGLLKPRSGFAVKSQANITAGVIDAGYVGEILMPILNPTERPIQVRVNDRIGQIIILKLPSVTFEEVENLEETPRGENRFGSSGE